MLYILINNGINKLKLEKIKEIPEEDLKLFKVEKYNTFSLEIYVSKEYIYLILKNEDYILNKYRIKKREF